MNEDIIYCESLFEDDFLTRSIGSAITTQADVALTELVANAWDAGATYVKISIPEQAGEDLYIEDDGTGMTDAEFQNRWMKLSYNRIKHQGRLVTFPEQRDAVRYAYGHNGVGRHGLLCFGDEYNVETKSGGKQLNLTVTTLVSGKPLAVINKTESGSQGHGTRLTVRVQRNLPKVEKVQGIISSRFLHDPQFVIEINGKILDLDNLNGILDQKDIPVVNTDIVLTGYFIDTKKNARKSIYQGIAFWQSGRLVGDPSWTLGNNMILDGRTYLAKRYTFIIKSDCLEDYIKEDWTGFKKHETMDLVYSAVESYVNECIEQVSTATIENVTENLSAEVKKAIKEANPLVKFEVEEVIKNIVISTPKVKQDAVDVAVAAVINLEQSKSGHDLLEKLSQLKSEDIDGLNELLDKWSVSDALTVLNEIDRRLKIIEAIRKLAKDKSTDELHVLHPMIMEARWLFGPEYESSEYIFNNQLRTALKKLFPDSKDPNSDTNYLKRPDLLCLPHSTISVKGVEDYSSESGLVYISKILLIELKRGGFKITRQEKDQANGYIDDLLNSITSDKKLSITAFVVGDEVAENLSPRYKCGNNDEGVLYVTTYDQLVDTAQRRMYGLREKLAGRYDDIPGMELYKQTRLVF